jgi:hypothetical protein
MLVKTTFKPAWWLKNPHLQTLYPALLRKVNAVTPRRRERLITPDDDFIDLDWCGEQHKPLIILLHGLTGSSKSIYIKSLQKKLQAEGFRTVTLNFRGCSGQSNHLARCYHSGDTEDIDFLYQTLRQREPDTPLAAVGFSLGANVLLKWLGEQGDKVTLFAAIAVSVPFVLSTCASRLDNGFSKLYRANLLTELKTYINDKQQHLTTIAKPEQAARLAELGDLSNIKSFWQYDERVVAKLHGFKNAHDYYHRSSSRPFIKTIAVPTLLIQAQDDPFMTAEVIPHPHELSATVQLEITAAGGHVGFISGNNPLKPIFWLEQRIPQFLHEQQQKLLPTA